MKFTTRYRVDRPFNKKINQMRIEKIINYLKDEENKNPNIPILIPLEAICKEIFTDCNDFILDQLIKEIKKDGRIALDKSEKVSLK